MFYHIANNGKGPLSNLTWPLKLLALKQMLQILPMALVQIKAGNTSENVLNEIRQITYFLFPENEINEKSLQWYNEFNTVIIQNGYYIYEFWKW